MAPGGFYAIYDPECQGVKLVDDEGYQQVKEVVTAGKPNIDSIDYEKCREVMRFKPIVIRRRKLSPTRQTDLVAVYEPSNQSVIAVTRADYEKNKAKYDQGPAPTLKPRTAPAPAPAPALTPAFVDAPVEEVKVPVKEAKPAPAPPSKPVPAADVQSFTSLIFQPPKIGRVQLSPDDLVAVYDPTTQSVIAIKRSQYESGVIPTAKAAAPQAAAPKVAAAEQKTSDLIFQAPKVGPIKLCPDDLLAVYHPQTQGVILVTRRQYDQGDISTPAAPTANTPSAPQQKAHLIFQPPKVGPIKLSPDDLLAVYQPATQGVVLVTRKQYDAGELPASAPAPAPAPASAPAPAAASAQSFNNLIFQPPKVGPISLCPNDLLAVYQPATQEVVLVTRKQYDAGELPSASAPSFTDLIFQPPKVGPISLCPYDLLAVYQPATQEVVLVTRKQYDAGELPSASVQSFTDLIFQPPKVGQISLCPDDLLAVYQPATQEVVLVTRKQYDAGEIPA